MAMDGFDYEPVYDHPKLPGEKSPASERRPEDTVSQQLLRQRIAREATQEVAGVPVPSRVQLSYRNHITDGFEGDF